MPIPDAQNATVAEGKVCDYLLNPAHPVGGPKSVWFKLIGYSLDNWLDLADDLLHLANTCEHFTTISSPHGVKYAVTGELGRPGHQRAAVVTIWLHTADEPPRLITAYPG